MSDTIEITINMIVHATESVDKFYSASERLFGIVKDQFRIRNTMGHFDNPILMLSVKVSDKMAMRILERISLVLSRQEKQDILNTINERMDNSGLYIRISKQEFIKGNIVLEDKNAVRIRIHRPVYKKKEMVQQYQSLLNLSP